MGKTIKEIQTKLKESERSIKMIETKVNVNKELLAELEEQFTEMHSNKDVNSRSILIQGIPKDRNENLKVLVHQILFDTKIEVPWSETDVIYRDGYYNKCQTRPIVVTFVRQSTQDDLGHETIFKKKTRCKEVWINEMIADDRKRQRNELKAICELTILKGYNARFHTDTIVINGITYDHSSISKLPTDFTLEAAFSRETDELLRKQVITQRHT